MTPSRRSFLKSGVLLTGTALSVGLPEGAAAAAAANRRYRKITVEEGFTIPELAEETSRFLASRAGQRTGFQYMEKFYRDLTPQWGRLSRDLGAGRLQAMDANGIDMQLLVLSAGALHWLEAGRASELAAIANNRLAQAIGAHPGRLAGLAAVAPQDPNKAAQELERGVRDLGLRGVIINSNVGGEYLDDRKYWPIFEAAQSLDVPVYLHPSVPAPSIIEPYKDYGLVGPMAGFNAETHIHALRLILSGLFDQFPRLRMVLGHLGEGIPFFLSRIDRAAENTVNHREPKLERLPSEYFRDHFVITTSGMNSPKVVDFCIDVLGIDKILFAIDYPYEAMMPDATALDGMQLSEEQFEKLFHGNAERVFDLATA